MTSIITGRGKYKAAGLTHPVLVKGGDDKLVFGYLADDAPSMAALWDVKTGKNLCPANIIYDIIGPWIVPPPARHECWVNIYDHGSLGYRNGGSVFTSSERADDNAGTARIGPARHMVELREGEVIVPAEPTRAMKDAAVSSIKSLMTHGSVIDAVWPAMLAARPK